MQVLVVLVARNLLALALDVALVLGLDLDLLGRLRVLEPRPCSRQRRELRVAHLGPAQELGERLLALGRLAEYGCERLRRDLPGIEPGAAQPFLLARDRVALPRVCLPARVAHHAQ